MKKITKISMIVVLVFLSLQSVAQTFGLKAGLNLSTALDKDDDETYSDDYKMNPGFHIGGIIDLPLNEFLSFESGLLFTTKGMKYEDEFMGAEFSAKATLYFIDIPLALKASHDLGGGTKIFAAAGPYVGFGLFGKEKAKIEYQGQEETEEADVEWGDDGNIKRLEMGLTFGGGVEFNAIVVGISYDLGLTNSAVDQDYGTTFKNRVLKFSVGYLFGK